jgi:hypothetical protein
MAKKVHKISKKWIVENRTFFRDFLDQTGFPDPQRAGARGPKFQYPEWLIMFIAILSVKLKIKSYIQIHRMAMEYWDPIAADLDLKPISERRPLHDSSILPLHPNPDIVPDSYPLPL